MIIFYCSSFKFMDQFNWRLARACKGNDEKKYSCSLQLLIYIHCDFSQNCANKTKYINKLNPEGDIRLESWSITS